MNFEHSIYTLTEFLSEYQFTVSKKEQHFVEFISDSVIITIAYANLERSYYIHIGENKGLLVELTPDFIQEILQGDQFQYHANWTIENLIIFLKTSGRGILSGDKEIFKKLNDFTERKSKEYTDKIFLLQNIQWADNAWLKKDYEAFIKWIDRTDKNLLPKSYLKKYRTAIDKCRETNTN